MNFCEEFDKQLSALAATSQDHFLTFDRQQWRALAATTDFPLTEDDVTQLRARCDPLDLEEADLVYRTLSGLLQVYVEGANFTRASTSKFLQCTSPRTPFVIGVAGSVAVGKSSTARLLTQLLRRWPNTPHVELVTSDGFLYSNAELEKRGLMLRKGYPESYNRAAIIEFLQAVKAGKTAHAPLYDHLTYDVTGKMQEVSCPDILIFEGINVLQPPRLTDSQYGAVAVSDFFDFSIYVDANPRHIESWYVHRFLNLRQTAFSNPNSYFHRYAQISTEAAAEIAHQIWQTINLPNLVENIAPTRNRATLILQKGPQHSVESVHLRKL